VEDRLAAVSAQLEGLSKLPVAAHPDVLEAVQRALVGELDLLRLDAEDSPPADPERVRRSA